MKLGCVSLCYKEERFIPKFIQSLQDRVDEILILNSLKPWNGEAEEDHSANIALSLGATVIQDNWRNEEQQRNAGQEYFADKDWIITLDPDEYILEEEWDKLINFLEVAPLPAYVPHVQHTYWKKGFVIDPPEDYKQIIAVKPEVRFVDKRVVNSRWAEAPIELHHMSWARSDVEVWRKITTYGHAGEFDPFEWFSNVWSDMERMIDLHPLTPKSLKKAVRVELPEELKRLDLWP